MDLDLVDRTLHIYGEAINLVEPLRVRFWHEHGLTIAQMGLLFVLYEDTRRREVALRGKGIHFVGCGISGGEEGALNGPSIMPGGASAPSSPDARSAS